MRTNGILVFKNEVYTLYCDLLENNRMIFKDIKYWIRRRTKEHGIYSYT